MARSRPRTRATIHVAPLSLVWAPNQPLTWIELTVAFMPSLFINATTSATRAGAGRRGGCVDEERGHERDRELDPRQRLVRRPHQAERRDVDRRARPRPRPRHGARAVALRRRLDQRRADVRELSALGRRRQHRRLRRSPDAVAGVRDRARSRPRLRRDRRRPDRRPTPMSERRPLPTLAHRCRAAIRASAISTKPRPRSRSVTYAGHCVRRSAKSAMLATPTESGKLANISSSLVESPT